MDMQLHHLPDENVTQMQYAISHFAGQPATPKVSSQVVRDQLPHAHFARKAIQSRDAVVRSIVCQLCISEGRAKEPVRHFIYAPTLAHPICNYACSDWDRIQSVSADQIIPYDKLLSSASTKNLQKLAVLKFNGGLGTSMGK